MRSMRPTQDLNAVRGTTRGRRQKKLLRIAAANCSEPHAYAVWAPSVSPRHDGASRFAEGINGIFRIYRLVRRRHAHEGPEKLCLKDCPASAAHPAPRSNQASAVISRMPGWTRAWSVPSADTPATATISPSHRHAKGILFPGACPWRVQLPRRANRLRLHGRALCGAHGARCSAGMFAAKPPPDPASIAPGARRERKADARQGTEYKKLGTCWRAACLYRKSRHGWLGPGMWDQEFGLRVRCFPGWYEENLDIPSGVEILGSFYKSVCLLFSVFRHVGNPEEAP